MTHQHYSIFTGYSDTFPTFTTLMLHAYMHARSLIGEVLTDNKKGLCNARLNGTILEAFRKSKTFHGFSYIIK